MEPHYQMHFIVILSMSFFGGEGLTLYEGVTVFVFYILLIGWMSQLSKIVVGLK